MSSSPSYKQLIVWQKSLTLVEEVYFFTRHMPSEELYGLTSQMRRAVVSIPSNIAEGSRRKTAAEYLQFLRVADGSASELETQLIIARRLYPNIPPSSAEAILGEVQKMIGGLIGGLRKSR